MIVYVAHLRAGPHTARLGLRVAWNLVVSVCTVELCAYDLFSRVDPVLIPVHRLEVLELMLGVKNCPKESDGMYP